MATPPNTSHVPSLLRIGEEFGEAVLEALWPTRCAVCDRNGALLCEHCFMHLPYIDLCRACPRCGAPDGIVQCTECNGYSLGEFDGVYPLDATASALICTDEAKRIVTTYKDKGERRLADVMARITALYLSPSWMQNAPVITFIPAAKKALNRRGFDHNELFSGKVAELCELPHMSLFERPKSADQRTLGKADRLANMRAALSLASGADVPRAVIIVDDVITTGATLFSAAEALRTGGAEMVYGLSFARV